MAPNVFARLYHASLSLTADWASSFMLRVLLDGLDMADDCDYGSTICELSGLVRALTSVLAVRIEITCTP